MRFLHFALIFLFLFLLSNPLLAKKKVRLSKNYESQFTHRGEVKYYFFTHLYSIPGVGFSAALAFHPRLNFGLFLTHELTYSEAKRYGGMFFRSELLDIRDSKIAIRGNLYFNRIKGLEIEWIFKKDYPFLANIGYHNEDIFYLGLGMLFSY